MKFVQIQQNVFYQSMYVFLTIQAEWDMLASLKWLKSGSKDLKVFKVTSDAMKIKVNTTSLSISIVNYFSTLLTLPLHQTLELSKSQIE